MAAGALVTVGGGCGEKNADPAGAEELLARVQQQDYHAWDRPPGWETRQASNGPHAEEVDIYVDDILSAAIAGPPITSWPTGSIIVKDGYNGGSLDVFAIMEKRVEGWYWAEYSGSGEPLYSGEPGVCLGCHASGADYVRAFGFPQ